MKKKPNSKIVYSLDPCMVTPAESIQIIAAGIYGAIFYRFDFSEKQKIGSNLAGD